MTTHERRHRNVAHLWADKRVLRFFRKHPTFESLHTKQRRSLQSVYMALCEIDSDFGEGATIKGFSKTVATYSGLYEETVWQYLRALQEARLIDFHQTREEGKFGHTGLVLFKWEHVHEEKMARSIMESLKHRARRTTGTVNTGHGETRPYKNPKGSNGKNPPKGGSKSTMASRSGARKGPSNKHKQLARLLQEAIECRRKINKTVNLLSWPLQVQKLCKSLDQPKAEARVYRVIKFLNQTYSEYGMQSEQHYIPTVESVRTFREKFGRVEDAMVREEQSGRRIITRRGGEAVLAGGEPGLDRKWFPLEDQEIDGKSVHVWENADGDKVICDTYPQPDPDGPMIGVPVTN